MKGCTLRVSASGERRRYAVALVIEDRYTPSDVSPASTVALQFLLEFYGNDNGECDAAPTFVSTTPAYGNTVVATETDGIVSASIDITVESSAAGQT